MSDANRAAMAEDRERLLDELARRESGDPGAPESKLDEATIQDLQSRLETLADDLRQPPPLDPFAEESDCRRATEWVERLVGEPEFSGHDIQLERIGPYEVVGSLGRGGMGTVLKAVHTKLRREVALKVLPADRFTSPNAITRFEREMVAIGALSHPNIVSAHDAGEVEGMHYLVMECVDGVDLSTLVRRIGPLAPVDACEIVRQAACGLAEAHDRGIVHRDIKPSNLMLSAAASGDAEPVVKILDFGLALLAPRHSGDTNLTTAGQIMGTLNYMAPEQCLESHTVDARADVYSLGATLYRLLSGRPPFGDDRFASPMSLISALGSEPPTPLSDLRSDLPPQLVAVVERMMANDPAERFASAQEVADVLAEWAGDAHLDRLLQNAQIESESPDADWRASRRIAIPRPIGRRSRQVPVFVLALGGAAVVAAAAMIVAWRSAGRWWAEIPITPLPIGSDITGYQQSRRVAEWLSSQHAVYGISAPNVGFLDITAGQPPPDFRFRLNTANLVDNRAIQDDDLKRFNNLPNFVVLVLTGTKIGDQGLRNLGHLPALDHLYLANTRVTDAGLAELKRFPPLDTVHVNATDVTDAGLVHLAEIDRLIDLELFDCHITDHGLPHLYGMTNLTRLHLGATLVTARGVAQLKRALPNCRIESDFSEDEIAAASQGLLTGDEAAIRRSRRAAEWLSSQQASYGIGTEDSGYLEVKTGLRPPTYPFLLETVNLAGNYSIRDEDLERLSDLPGLSLINLADTYIGDEGLHNLKDLPRLANLFLSGSQVTDAGLSELKRFDGLETLYLTATSVTDDGLEPVASLNSLVELSLARCPITDLGLNYLLGLKHLKTLSLTNTDVTAQGIGALQRALPDCRIESTFSDQEISTAIDQPPRPSNSE